MPAIVFFNLMARQFPKDLLCEDQFDTSKAMVIQIYCGENIGFRFSPLPRHLNVGIIPKMIYLSKKDLSVKIARPNISFIVRTVFV